MRDLVVNAFVTLDGVMQAPGGPEEDPSGGFAHGGWSVNYWDDSMAKLMAEFMSQPFDLLLGRRTYEIRPRTRPANVKDAVVAQRGYKVLRTTAEDVVEFDYRPGRCTKDYRVVALRKNISVGRGQAVLFDEYRYFFYITNDRALSADEVVGEARQRCNQENLIAQLKGGVRALHVPVNTLNANWAYITMASLAWSIKAWCALLLPVSPRWAERHGDQRRRLLTMEFRTFRQAFIDIPCQIDARPAASSSGRATQAREQPISTARHHPSAAMRLFQD